MEQGGEEYAVRRCETGAGVSELTLQHGELVPHARIFTSFSLLLLGSSRSTAKAFVIVK